MNTPLMSLSIQISLLAHHTHTRTYTVHINGPLNWFENQNMPFSIRYVILCSNKNIEINLFVKLSTRGRCVFSVFHIGRFFRQEIFFCRQF